MSIAQGLPAGGGLNHANELTLNRARESAGDLLAKVTSFAEICPRFDKRGYIGDGARSARQT